jgi:hypothetical protein
MTRRRRFYIFFMSAGLTSLVILVTLYFRKDSNVSDSYDNMMPSSRAKVAILGETQDINFTAKATCLLKCLNMTEDQLVKALEQEGEVDLMNDKTDTHKAVKQYYMETSFGTKTIYVIVNAVFGRLYLEDGVKMTKRGTSLIGEIGIVDETSKCDCK